jgi:hypothetical protein
MLALLVIVIGAAVRVPLLASHFSHIDDLAVAVGILDAKAHPPRMSDLTAEARWKVQEGRSTPRVALLLRAAEVPGVSAVADAIAPSYPFLVTPLKMTYAPLQFVATAAILTPGESYEATKWRGRLPSLVACVLTMLLAGVVAARLWPANWSPLFLTMTALLAFSFEYTVMAAQMYAYAAAATSTMAMLALAATARPQTDLRWRTFGLYALLPVALCYLSYQSILLLPGLYAALAAAVLTQTPVRQWVGRLLRLGLLAAVTGAFVLPAFLLRLSTVNTVGWNAGLNGAFVFSAGEAVGPFLARNGWAVMQGMLSPLPEAHPALALLTGLLAAACFLGAAVLAFAALRWRNWSAAGTVGVFVAVALAVLLALTLMGRLTLSPTRHLVAYLPILALLAGVGAQSLAGWSERALGRRGGWAETVAAVGIALVVGLAYAASYPQFMQERRDAFSEARLVGLAQANGATLVAGYGSTLQPLAMPALQRVAAVANLDDPSPSAMWPDVRGPTRVLLVSHRNALSEEDCRKLFQRLKLQPTAACLDGAYARQVAAEVSPVEVDYSRSTQNGTNGFFATVLSVAPGPK